jgi:hypothetical protein
MVCNVVVWILIFKDPYLAFAQARDTDSVIMVFLDWLNVYRQSHMISKPREAPRFEKTKPGVLLRCLVVYCGTIHWERRIVE